MGTQEKFVTCRRPFSLPLLLKWHFVLQNTSCTGQRSRKVPLPIRTSKSEDTWQETPHPVEPSCDPRGCSSEEVKARR